MRLHHGGHHQAYTDKLNLALGELRADASTKHLAKMGIDQLLQHLDEVPSRLRGSIRNNGGGFVNHEIFWQTMSPVEAAPGDVNDADSALEVGSEPGPAPGSKMARELERAFGSYAGWRSAFSEACMGVFGSGWCWLVVNDETGALSVQTTPNQDTPASTPHMHVVLGLDVWEHASYLQYRNKRAKYFIAWLHVVNWAEAEHRMLPHLRTDGDLKEAL